MARKKQTQESEKFDYDYDYEYDVNDTVGKKKKKGSGTKTSGNADEGERAQTKNERTDDSSPRGEEKRERASDKAESERNPSALWVQIATAVMFVLAVFLVLCFAFSGGDGKVVGAFGGFIGRFFLGLFGVSGLLIPLLLIVAAIRFKREYAEYKLLRRLIFSILSLVLIAVIVHTFFCIFGGELVVAKGSGSFYDGISFKDGTVKLYTSGEVFVGGGLIGGFISVLMMKVVGSAGAIIFSALFLALCLMFVVGTSPAAVWSRIKFYIIRGSERRAAAEKTRKERKERKKEKAEQNRPETSYSTYNAYDPSARTVVVKGVHRTPDRSADDADTDSDVFGSRKSKQDNISDAFHFGDTTELAVYDEKLTPVNNPAKTDLSDIFDKPDDEEIKSAYDEKNTDDDDFETSASIDVKAAPTLDVRRTQTTKRAPDTAVVPKKPAPEKQPPKEPEKPKYVFPSIDLLGYKPPNDEGNIEQELRTKAQKLVETLDSFNIHTKVVNISRGPAVTRYEIAPEAGTRVSAIVNRADDISLGLASSVLIEGVIPGKSAIGIEVPNKNVSTVYLRELIDSDQFRESKSRLTASLGIDLTGSKVFFDIAKMPHLLIAGATGMGKSVCINSILVSLLYKSTPDEVKFILVDPKKVEFNIYDGLPHLLVPVVSDPKKAAGALNWCVTEMERRYDILEAKNKRNLAQYNEAIADDPEAERLPQIVIVIDELADLMLTAKDVVETSIARIAAKARAAGMHLIIGTQRPSVDVITGTIKANIPSRIACTVSSQTDSRTILDGAGAEKLVGRGDMLFAPVGARMPLRVQGAYVDEKEIEDIVAFIKEHAGVCAYDRDIADQIEREAELCGKKGKATVSDGGAGDGEEEDDPMLDEAIKLAIEEKKISTSLIQRRLQLGYGRAAKLIDIMEARGIVSAPNGQKPRDVLISYEDYLEMSMRSDD